jgi:hypothetical protein
METEKIEKRLLYFDQAAYSRQLADFQRNRDILNELAELYEGPFKGKMSRARLDQIFSGNFEAIKEAATLAIAKSARDQILTDVRLEIFEDKFLQFQTNASRLVARFDKIQRNAVFPTETPREWFSISSEGRFFIPDSTLDEIRERCSNYIETEQQQHIWELCEKLAALNNEIYEALGKRARAEMDVVGEHRHKVISDLLTSDSTGKTIPDPQTNYQFLTK